MPQNKNNPTIIALKAARLKKGLNRREVSRIMGWTPKAIEQIENGRCNISEKRLHKIITGLGYSQEEFEQIQSNPHLALAEVCEQKKEDGTVKRKPRRNEYKLVTKEARVLRVLRQKKGISQHEASLLCGYKSGLFGFLEAGRITLKEDRIKHILKSLNYKWMDFESLMKAPVLHDEIIEEITPLLPLLEDEALIAVAKIIKAFIKKGENKNA